MVDQEALAYLAVTVTVALIVVGGSGAMGPLSLIAVILGLGTVIFLLVIFYADFLVFPLFTKLAGISIIPAKNYYIPKSEDAVIKEINGIYYATGFLTANIYNYVFAAEGISEAERASISAAPDKWERAVMNVAFPFKFNIVSTSQDVQKYREELEAQRGLCQFQYSKEASATNANPMTLQDIERRIRIVQAKIDRLGEGERPVDTILYMESTAFGVSEKDALDSLTNQLNQLQTVFSGFDLSIMRIYGREIYLLYRLNYALPGVDELKSMFTVQR